MVMEKPQMHIKNIEKSKYRFFHLINSGWIEYLNMRLETLTYREKHMELQAQGFQKNLRYQK